MLRKKSRGTRTEFRTKGYRAEFFRKKMLAKSFKGNEKGYKTLDRLAETIQTGMEVLWRQGIMCDIELITQDRKHFRAHRLVLATCSDYFYDMLVEPEDDISFMIEIPDIRGDVLEYILEAMYTGKVKTEANNVDDLLVAANMLGMFVVMDACQQFLLDIVNKENCLQLLATSVKYNLTQLTEHSLTVAAKNFLSVSKSPAFRLLPVEHLLPLLNRDDLNVTNELEVFHRARAWLENNGQYRRQHAADILGTIRLPLLTPAEIVDNVENCSALSDVNGCQRLVKEALHYHLMPSRQCLLQSPRTVPRRRGEVSLVVVGGAPRLTSDPVSNTVTRFNLENHRWELVTKMPEPRHHHAVAVLNGFLYIAGGEVVTDACTPVNTVHRFDPRTGTWMRVANMLNSRQSFQLCVLNSAIYAVGGRVSNDELLSAVEKYDPALDRWEEVASLSCPRRCVAVGSMTGRLYAVGGSSAKAISSRAERYNPTENRWEMIRATNVPRFFGHLQSVTNHLYLLGGAGIDVKGNIVCVDTIERYTNTANQWTVIASMRTPRSEAGSTVIKEKIYIVGGYNWNNNERITEVECFDTETNSWTTLPKLQMPLTGIAAGSLLVYEKEHDDLTNNANAKANSDIKSFSNDTNIEKKKLSVPDDTRKSKLSSIKEEDPVATNFEKNTARPNAVSKNVEQYGKLKNSLISLQETDLKLEVGREFNAAKKHDCIKRVDSGKSVKTGKSTGQVQKHTPDKKVVKTRELEQNCRKEIIKCKDSDQKIVKNIISRTAKSFPQINNKHQEKSTTELANCKSMDVYLEQTTFADRGAYNREKASEDETGSNGSSDEQANRVPSTGSSADGDVRESRTFPDLSNNCSKQDTTSATDGQQTSYLIHKEEHWDSKDYHAMKASTVTNNSTVCKDGIQETVHIQYVKRLERKPKLNKKSDQKDDK